MNRAKDGWALLRDTYREWQADKVPRLAAALSYYTIFSIAPLLIVVIAVAGLAFGEEAVRGQLDNQIQGLIGREGADTIQEIIANSSRPADNILATVIGVVTLLLGASGVFGQLQEALNTVWGVEPKPGQGILAIVKDRFFSFTMVLGVGFLLLVSLIISTVLSAVNTFAVGLLPGWETLFMILNQVISFLVITLLFGMIYKVLPDVKIAWRDVWVGAAITALLFTIGKALIGLYLGNSSIASTYGAAGSFAVILVWIFYSAQILLFGAEFTQVYAKRYGSRIVPDENAVTIPDAVRMAQGMPPKGKLVPTKLPLAGEKTGEPIPSLQTQTALTETPPPAAAPPLPVLWMIAAGLIIFVGGRLTAKRD